MEAPLTHAQLVARAQRWLRQSLRHSVVVAEMGRGAEVPDVIGWTNRGQCTLVECKATRVDYLRDRQKSFRRDPARGMGLLRWYCAPPGVIEPPSLPDGWGLAECDDRCMRVLRKPLPQPAHYAEGEAEVLVSALRRATEGWGRNVFGDISPMAGQIDPHPSVAAAIKKLAHAERSEREKRQRRDERVALLEGENAELRARLGLAG